MKHYLVIEQAPYEECAIFGIFETLEAAREYVEQNVKARYAEIQEWEGAKQVESFYRPSPIRRPSDWLTTVRAQ